jgi:hypothetical protein
MSMNLHILALRSATREFTPALVAAMSTDELAESLFLVERLIETVFGEGYRRSPNLSSPYLSAHFERTPPRDITEQEADQLAERVADRVRKLMGDD